MFTRDFWIAVCMFMDAQLLPLLSPHNITGSHLPCTYGRENGNEGKALVLNCMIGQVRCSVSMSDCLKICYRF